MSQELSSIKRAVRTVVAACVGLLTSAVSAAPSAQVDFNRDVRPILSDNCFACHGPDKNARKAELRLDTRDGAVQRKDGRSCPGKPDESELVRRHHGRRPRRAHAAAEVEQDAHRRRRSRRFARWIAAGGRSTRGTGRYIAADAAAGAAVKDAAWSGTRSTLRPGAKLRSEGPDARRPRPTARRCIRRLSFDLTGLPPTPAEVDAFVERHSRPTPTRRLVDRLLASRTTASGWRVYWLDLVRYADTTAITATTTATIVAATATRSSRRSTATSRSTSSRSSSSPATCCPNATTRPADRHRASTAAT